MTAPVKRIAKSESSSPRTEPALDFAEKRLGERPAICLHLVVVRRLELEPRFEQNLSVLEPDSDETTRVSAINSEREVSTLVSTRLYALHHSTSMYHKVPEPD